MNFRTQRFIVRLIRSIGVLILFAIAFFGLVSILIVVQGQREDTRQAGAAVVLDGSGKASAQLDWALNLHRRGTIKRIFLFMTENSSAGQQYLLQRGVPAESLILIVEPQTRYDKLKATSRVAYNDTISSFLLVGEPWEMLTTLKMAQDLGMVVYPAPTTRVMSGNDAIAVLSEAGSYIRYIFLGY